MIQNKLILGTAQFGLTYGINNSHGKPSEKEVFNILDFAYEKGIRILDTAEAYGDAIEIISKYHKISKNKFEIISKFKYTGASDIEYTITKTINQLSINSLYGYMFHAFEDIKKYPELVEKISNIHKKKLIKHIGVSVYSNEQFEEVLNRNEFDLIQLPYNLLDNKLQRGNLIAQAKHLGKIIHVRSVFLQGLFFKDIVSITTKNILFPLIENLNNLHKIALSAQVSITAIALQYPLLNCDIDGVLFGVDTLTQLEENIQQSEIELNESIFFEIDKIEVNNKCLLSPINWK